MAGNTVYDLQQEGIVDRTQEFLNIRIGVFFDGTKNNSTNVRLREAYQNPQERSKMTQADRLAYEKNGKVADGEQNETSYGNAITNVVKLYDVYLKNTDSTPYTDKVYIEGIGTLNKDDDDVMDGPALGRGSHGIRGKIFRACHQISQLKNLQTDSLAKQISVITLDVFGFSRGAAAARNFAYEIIRKDSVSEEITTETINGEVHPETVAALNLQGDPIDHIKYKTDASLAKFGMLGYCLNKYSKVDMSQIKIKIRYVGLFDTVASYHKRVSLSPSPDFQKDLPGLHLNYGMDGASKVVHLTSEDEIRKNFSLSVLPPNILAKKNNVEISFPGVHSDIGGGYTPNYHEKISIESAQRLFFFYKTLDTINHYIPIVKNYRSYLISQRWFKDNEISYLAENKEIRSNRINISDKYSDIPLNIMYELMGGKDLFKEETFKSRYDIVPNYATHNKLVQLMSAAYDKMLQDQAEHIRIYENNKATEAHRSGTLFSFSNPYPGLQQDVISFPFKIFINSTLSGYIANKMNLPLPGDNEMIYHFYKKMKYRLNGNRYDLKILTAEEFIHKYALISGKYHTIEVLQDKKSDIINGLIEQFLYGVLRNRYLHWSAKLEATAVLLFPHEQERNMDVNDFNRKRSIYNI